MYVGGANLDMGNVNNTYFSQVWRLQSKVLSGAQNAHGRYCVKTVIRQVKRAIVQEQLHRDTKSHDSLLRPGVGDVFAKRLSLLLFLENKTGSALKEPSLNITCKVYGRAILSEILEWSYSSIFQDRKETRDAAITRG